MRLEVNDLVEHKKGRFKGIGCVAKAKRNGLEVNHGTDEVMVCKAELLEKVDTSDCTEMTMVEFRAQNIGGNPKHDTVIIGNEVKHYVGIGWVSNGVVTREDFKKYPRIVQG